MTGAVSANSTGLTWPARIDELAAAHSDLVAVSTTADGGERLTWGDLAAVSRSTAGLFARMGVGRGDVVCVQLPGCAAHVLCAYAAWRLGATVLPLRADLPGPERRRLLDLARPALTITTEPEADRPEMHVDEMLAEVSAGRRSGAGEPWSDGTDPVADPAWLIASGGSTGAPKLIASATSTFRPSAVANALLVTADAHRHPVHLVTSPLYHTQGFALLHHTLVDDFRVVILSRFEPEAVLDLIEEEGVAFAAFVPTMLVRLLRSPSIRSRDFSSLERVTSGGGACPDWVVREWIDLVGPDRFLMGYGSSEAVCSAQIGGDDWLRHPGSVGRPQRTDVLVVDEEGSELPPGGVGELFYRPRGGEARVRYVGGSEPRRRSGGYVSIGDLGWVDQDGYLYIADRRTDMVVSGGANVYVSEVEAALLLHPEVEDVAVVGLPDPEWGRRVHAIVQLTASADREGFPTSARAHCRLRLAAYKVPKTYEVVDSLGRTEAGKINRRALAEARSGSSEGMAEPSQGS